MRSGNVDARCSVVFQENFLRGKEALDAFKVGFEEGLGRDGVVDPASPQSGPRSSLESTNVSPPLASHLEVYEFGSDFQTVDIVGAIQGALADSNKRETKVIVCAVDDAALAIQTATNRLAGTMVMADMTSWEKTQEVALAAAKARFDLTLKSNDEGMLKATKELVDSILKGKPLQDHTLVQLKY